VTAVVTSHTGVGTGSKAVLDGFRPGIVVATGIGLFGLLVSLSGVWSERRSRGVVAENTDDFGPADEEFALAGQDS